MNCLNVCLKTVLAVVLITQQNRLAELSPRSQLEIRVEQLTAISTKALHCCVQCKVYHCPISSKNQRVVYVPFIGKIVSVVLASN